MLKGTIPGNRGLEILINKKGCKKMNANEWETFKQLIKTPKGKERFLELVGIDLLDELGLLEEDKLDLEIDDFIKRMDGKLNS